ncbi:hypothetical protein Ahy_A05g022081 [Arachis hypogaea]|uniref:MULE transposase domain-containing protein n=1 Tax=Arachis hypogaea TaxID=3818 RepID=A0A445CZM7_ARAHY|nr:hypothetical protein Ahy_A05g022081 [Arachis hypogaea]
MNNNISFKIYYNGQILSVTAEGVIFMCNNPCISVLSFMVSFEEFKSYICQNIDPYMPKRVTNILYRRPILVFGEFVQFHAMCINDDTSLQEMLSIYHQAQSQVSVIELYVEFDQLPNTVEQHDHDFDWKSYNGDSEEEYEGNYDFVDPNADEEQEDCTIESDVEYVTNALTSEHPFEEPSFMHALDLDAMNAPEFPEYANADPPVVEDGKFVIGMEFKSREAVIKAAKDYTIHRGVDYRDHSKLDSDTIAEAIKPLVEADPSIKVRLVIADVQSKFNYTISYRKAWLAKQKAVEKIFEGWKASYEALPTWFEAMVKIESSTAIEYETLSCYRGDELAQDVRVLNQIFWSFYPCIRAFRHCKPVIQVDGTHLFEKYKGALLVAVSQDGNNNIVPIAFALVEGETSDAWFFFLRHLRTRVVTKDGVGLIFDRHESIRSAVSRCDGAWEPPRAKHMFCIRYIASNFSRKFKASFMQKLVVNIGYSRTVDEYEIRYQRLRSQVTEKIQQDLIAAGNIMVSSFDRQNGVFEVQEMSSGVEYVLVPELYS